MPAQPTMPMPSDAMASSSDGLGFDMAVLGQGLPAQAEALIAQAGLLRHESAWAERLLWEAQALAPKHPATLIALYRFHFYGHRLREARRVAEQALRVARAALLPGESDPEQAPLPGFTDEQARFDAVVRFYLFSLKGYAYLSLRLGEMEAGRAALAALRQLDPQDRVGGAVLAVVLARAEAGDDGDAELDVDDQAHAQGRQPHRGWGAA